MKYRLNTNINLKSPKSRFDLKSCQSNRTPQLVRTRFAGWPANRVEVLSVQQ